MKWYRDYVWEKGVPLGKGILDKPEGVCYKIIKDGYDKRITVEKYAGEVYDSTVYDALLLDFRKLNLREQKAWSKELIKGDEYILRDIDGRAIYKEICHYEKGILQRAETYTPFGQLLAVSVLVYEGEFQGAILFDPEMKQVMKKRYKVVGEELTDLIEIIQ